LLPTISANASDHNYTTIPRSLLPARRLDLTSLGHNQTKILGVPEGFLWDGNIFKRFYKHFKTFHLKSKDLHILGSICPVVQSFTPQPQAAVWKKKRSADQSPHWSTSRVGFSAKQFTRLPCLHGYSVSC